MDDAKAKRIYNDFLNGVSMLDLPTRHCITPQEVRDAIQHSRKFFPEFNNKDILQITEVQLFEEIAKLQKFRQEAGEGYRDTKVTEGAQNNFNTSITETRTQKNFSAVASLSREIRETLKLLLSIRGLITPTEADTNIINIVQALEKAPNKDEWARDKSTIVKQIRDGNGRRTIP